MNMLILILFIRFNFKNLTNSYEPLLDAFEYRLTVLNSICRKFNCP